MSPYLLAIDQGTTSSRAIVFSCFGEIVSQHQIDLMQTWPDEGWVEQDPMEMWTNTLECCRQALHHKNLKANDIAAIGIANQRETTIIWDRNTGKPIYPAIVWQDRRTSDFCREFSQHAIASSLRSKTGLMLDPYFSASKIVWILDHVPQARERAQQGELAFGTVDTFLLWQLTKGKVHATDATNASRTLLFNIVTQQWDRDILSAFNIPEGILPSVLDSSSEFGYTDIDVLGAPVLIAAIIGDQQAATIGQACFSPGMIKSTYGTGSFMFLNTGKNLIQSHHQLLSTIAYRLQGEVTYGLEGSIFSAGTIIKWLRDKLKLIKSAAESEILARNAKETGGVYFVPAFTGLGAPYWDPKARAAVLGLTCDSDAGQVVRAGLESIGYQTRDLLSAMVQDCKTNIDTMRVDGGMVNNDWLMQFLADISSITIQRPKVIETTALGAAYLAGLQVGMYQSLEEISTLWRENKKFLPMMERDQGNALYAGWKSAVNQILTR